MTQETPPYVPLHTYLYNLAQSLVLLEDPSKPEHAAWVRHIRDQLCFRAYEAKGLVRFADEVTEEARQEERMKALRQADIMIWDVPHLPNAEPVKPVSPAMNAAIDARKALQQIVDNFAGRNNK